MLTNEEKEQLEAIGDAVEAISDAVSSLPEPTVEEKEQIGELVDTFAAIKTVVESTVAEPAIETAPKKFTDLSKLVNNGNLKVLKEKIATRMPVTDEQYDILVKAMKDDIKKNSRLNGIVKNVSVLANAIVKEVIPLFLKAV